MKYNLLPFLLIFPLFLAAQTHLDSLRQVLQQTNQDTVKVNTMIRIWQSIAYTDPVEANKVARDALVLSRNAGYKRGEAEALQRIAAGYSVRNINDSARIFYEEALQLYSEMGNTRLEGVMLYDIGILYYNEGKYINAMLKTEESLKKASETDDEHGVASTLQLLGNINHYLGNYEEAQRYLIQSQEVLDKLGDRVRYTDGLVYLATNFNARGKQEKALKHLREAIELYREMEDYIFLAQALNNTGYIYLEMRKYDSSAYYLNQVIDLTTTYENNGIKLLALNNLGRISKEKKQYDRARQYFGEALILARQHNDRLRIATTYRNLGNLFSDMGKVNKSLPYYDSALVYGKQVRSKNSQKFTFLALADAHEKTGDFKSSLAYFRKYSNLKDSIFDEDQTRKMEEMDARYEKVKKDKEIAIQKSQIDILSKDLELQRIKLLLLIIGLSVVIFLGFFIVISQRQKMKRNRLIREQEKLIEKEKLKIAELQRDKYEMQLAYKKNELTSHALQIVQKNELLSSLKNRISEMEKNSNDEIQPGYRQLKNMINGSAQTDKEWENFKVHFDQVHQGFVARLKSNHPELTSNDLRLASMLKLNLSSKEVASIMNISPESVKKARYRLRKKLDMPEESDLHAFMMKV